MDAVRVGVVGAGPWASMYHAPMLAAGPHTTLTAVYGRRFEAAAALAEQYGARAGDDLQDFLDHCEAVAFCVPPDVQAALVPVVAAAGKPMLLEKPIALTLPDARAMTAAVTAAGVPTQLMLTRRYSAGVREFLTRAATFPTIGVRAAFVSGAFLPGSPFATPWRLREGALLDVGPHILDLMDAAAGPIESIDITGDPLTWVAVTTRHAGGAIGQAGISSVVPGYHWECTLFGPEGALLAPERDEAERPTVMQTIAAEFATTVRTGRSHPLDIHRGLYLQELMQGRG
jgi:predicted dehydrogenase